MKRTTSIAMMAVCLAMLLPYAYALENIGATTELDLALSSDGNQVNETQSITFLNTISISNYQALKEFSPIIQAKEGVSFVNVTVNGNYCDTRKIVVINPTTFRCTANVTTNLSSSILNVTITNIGYADSSYRDLTLTSVIGHFVIDSNAQINVTPFTLADINTIAQNHEDSLFNRVQSWFSNHGVSYFLNRTTSTGQTVEYELTHGGTLSNANNGTVNVTFNSTQLASDVWNYKNLTASNETTFTMLFESWKVRLFGGAVFRTW